MPCHFDWNFSLENFSSKFLISLVSGVVIYYRYMWPSHHAFGFLCSVLIILGKCYCVLIPYVRRNANLFSYPTMFCLCFRWCILSADIYHLLL